MISGIVHFCGDDAEKHGITAAVILHVLKCEAKGCTGEAWITKEGIERMYPFLNSFDISAAFDQLEEEGIVQQRFYLKEEKK